MTSNLITAKPWIGLEYEKIVIATVTATLSDGVTYTSKTMMISFAPKIIDEPVDEAEISENTITEVIIEKAPVVEEEFNFINLPRFVQEI